MLWLKGSRSYNKQLLSMILGNNSVREGPKYLSAYLRVPTGANPSLPGLPLFLPLKAPSPGKPLSSEQNGMVSHCGFP